MLHPDFTNNKDESAVFEQFDQTAKENTDIPLNEFEAPEQEIKDTAPAATPEKATPTTVVSAPTLEDALRTELQKKNNSWLPSKNTLLSTVGLGLAYGGVCLLATSNPVTPLFAAATFGVATLQSGAGIGVGKAIKKGVQKYLSPKKKIQKGTK